MGWKEEGLDEFVCVSIEGRGGLMRGKKKAIFRSPDSFSDGMRIDSSL